VELINVSHHGQAVVENLRHARHFVAAQSGSATLALRKAPKYGMSR
jgi:hypothetical protein